MTCLLRQVGYKDRAQTALQRIFGSAEVADDRFRAAEWVLAKTPCAVLVTYPCAGTTPSGQSIYIYRSQPGFQTPPMVILFSVSADDQQIYVHAVHAVAPTAPAKGDGSSETSIQTIVTTGRG